ncbi:tetratricopeptide repeat protein, partial [Bradyrhizobium sp. Pear76]|nr:tetratricopeptide repeat protein [Bradyrhizobium oropedii]
MARTAAAGTWSLGRAWARTARLCLLATGLALTTLTYSTAARAEDPVPGEATFSAANGYARLVLRLKEDVESEVTTAGSIIVIRFKRPVDIPVEKLSDAVPDYVGAARRDPDGSAIRLSLARRVTVNTMTAGERIFVDFLPDGWTGPPPSLPQEVIRELAERARAAERLLRIQRAADAAKKKPPIRVRALVQPTFVRFVFEVPDGVSVSSVLNEQKLSLSFNSVLTFDLADAKVAAPPNVASISSRSDTDTSAVDVTLIGDVDVHSFRDEKNYIVDVAFQQNEQQQAAKPSLSSLSPTPRGKAKSAAAIAPVTSESIAQQAKIEIKPEQAKVEPAKSEPLKPEPLKSELPQPQSEAVKSEQGGSEQPAIAPAKIERPRSELPNSELPKIAAAPAADVERAAVPHDGSAGSEPEPGRTPASEAPKPVPAAAAAAAMETPKPNVAPSPSAEARGKSVVEAQRDSDGLRVTFSFPGATPAALFRRADTVWMVFDTADPIDVDPIRAKGGALISDVSRIPLEKGQAVRFRLNRPQMPSLESDDRSRGVSWTLTFADRVQKPPLPLTVVRNISEPSLANVSVPLANPGQLHKLVDPDAGDTLWVVTAPPPTRGIIKRQDFVELSLLESIHGVVVHPNADDVKAEVGADKVMLG